MRDKLRLRSRQLNEAGDEYSGRRMNLEHPWDVNERIYSMHVFSDGRGHFSLAKDSQLTLY